MEFNATFLISAISFVIFSLIMNKILYQPITDIVNKRNEYLNLNSKETKANLNGADDIRHENDAKIRAARNDIRARVAQQIDVSNAEKALKEQEKRSELREQFNQKQEELETESAQASAVLEHNIGELSNSIVSKLTGGAL